jgi:hypothetical protein
VFEQRELHLPSLRLTAQLAALMRARLRDVGHAEHFAVDVELELIHGRVAHPHRQRALVPWKPVEDLFRETAPSGGAVHRL